MLNVKALKLNDLFTQWQITDQRQKKIKVVIEAQLEKHNSPTLVQYRNQKLDEVTKYLQQINSEIERRAALIDTDLILHYFNR